MLSRFFESKRVFITGNTGFKGSWLSHWLMTSGANVRGYSISIPTQPSLFKLLKHDKEFSTDFADVRNYDRLLKSLKGFRPQIVFHLAAQPLVLRSYREPLYTFSTNVMGTANLLEAIRSVPS